MLNTSAEERAVRDKALFDRIAVKYAAKDLIKSCRVARKRRLMRTIDCTGGQSFERILEVGCGAGYASDYLRGRYEQYVGIDYSEELIDAAKSLHKSKKISFEVADATSFADGAGFDLVFMIGVLHHLPEPIAALRNLRRLLKPGGLLAVNEPQSGNPLITMARNIRKMTDTSYSDDQDAYSYKELKAILEDGGLKVLDVFPQGVLSTPFAEVPMPLQLISHPLGAGACAADVVLDRFPKSIGRRLSWNLIGIGHNAL